METKLVIIIRKDLRMRRGKEIAQGAHAAMAWLARRLLDPVGEQEVVLSAPEHHWLQGSQTKVTVTVNSEAELRELVDRARFEALVPAELIVDEGRTEFQGRSTVTAAAIGPATVELVDRITGHLPLY